MLVAIHRYARLGVMAILTCAAGAACLTGSSSAPPQPEAAARAPVDAVDGNAAAPSVDEGQSQSAAAPDIPTSAQAPSPDSAPEPDAKASGQPTAQPEASPEMLDTPTNGSNTVQLSPYNLSLPQSAEDAPDAVRNFNVAAVRAVQRVYREDADDPSVLLALQDQLLQRPELRPLIPLWQQPLSAGMSRATILQALGPTLRSLRSAMANAYFDERLRLYRDVDSKACDTAFANLPSQDETLLNFVVTVEPVGTYPLSKFRSFCNDSRATSLKERRLPGRPAPESVVRLVRRLYNQAHLGGQVRKVSIIQPWQRDTAHHQTTLHAAIGVLRSAADTTEEPCTMAEISVIKPLQSSEPPVIGEVGEREPILCNQLK